MEKLNGVIQKVKYTGEDNYAVLSVKIPQRKEAFDAAGRVEYPVKKIGIYMEGEWGYDETRQQEKFYITKSVCDIDKKTAAAIKFLSSGLIKYIGDATAREIIMTYGTDVKTIMAHPEKLLTIRGITSGRIPEIYESYRQNKPLFEIFEVTSGAVTCRQAEKIYKKYGKKSAEVLRNNPYVLIYDIGGFGFRKADLLAREIGYKLDSMERCAAGVTHCFRSAEDEKGHCFLYYGDVIDTAVNILINSQEAAGIYYKDVLKTSVPNDLADWETSVLGDLTENHVVKFNNLIKKLAQEEDRTDIYDSYALNSHEISCLERYLELRENIEKNVKKILLEQSIDMTKADCAEAFHIMENDRRQAEPKRFVFDKDRHGDIRYYDAKTFFLELKVVFGLKAIAKQKPEISFTEEEISRLIAEEEASSGMQLGAEQKEAVKKSLMNRVFITTGGPGRGKTTIMDLTIKGWTAKGGRVVLLAPTGRAAQRMTEATGYPAETIHRRVLSLGGGRVGVNIEPGLVPTLVLIDEMSMCTLELLNKVLMYAQYCHLGFVGDADQLPCIGLGNVFEDMIESGKVACTRLTTCYRNAGSVEQNSVVINRGGRMSELQKDHQFKMFLSEDVDLVQQNILKIYGKMLDKYDKKDIGVLVPSRQRGKTCVNELNRLIQKTYNPSKNKAEEIHYMDVVFRIGDRVLNRKNDYHLECCMPDGTMNEGVFNGETGEVVAVNNTAETLTVRFDDGKTAVYGKKTFPLLQLAYAMTAHKSQGCQYPCVIIALVNADYMLLTRKILYTAETRAKDLVVLLGSAGAIGKAMSNAHVEKRNTTIAERCGKIWDTDEMIIPWEREYANREDEEEENESFMEE